MPTATWLPGAESSSLINLALITVHSLKKVFQNSKKKLFGLGLEQKDTKRAETAKVISTSLGKLNHTLKKFFVFDPPKIQRRVGKAIIPVVRQQLFQRQAFNNRTTWKGGPFNRRGSSRRMPNISGL